MVNGTDVAVMVLFVSVIILFFFGRACWRDKEQEEEQKKDFDYEGQIV